MQTRIALASFLLLLPHSVVSTPAQIRGLNPALAEKYVANARGNFKCLDGSKEIPFARVNDDYCDCADGSDEPGTSACNNGTFYCRNEGHEPAIIDSARVNDGVCDPQCCDGSDEWDSHMVCPNTCDTVGRAHRELRASQEKEQKAGQQRLRQLVREASGLRKIKREELARKQLKLADAEVHLAEAEQLKDMLEKQEQEMRASQDSDRAMRKQSLFDEYLPDLIVYRRHLAMALHRSRWQRDSLIMLLRAVRREHNAEFNDEAVSLAVKEYSEFADTYPYLENAAASVMEEGEGARTAREQEMDRDSELQDDKNYEACRDAINIAESERETSKADIDLLYGILAKLRDDYNKNYHDLAVKAAVVGLGEFEQMRDADSTAISSQYETLEIAKAQERVAEAKARLELILDETTETLVDSEQPDADFQQRLADARSAYYTASSDKSQMANDVSVLSELLGKDLGERDMYLPLKDKCYSLDAGEYTYEVCLLDQATQISNKDNSRQHLGSFAEFAKDSDGITLYATHKYLNGNKCWNGPNRSLIATFECAEEIEIVKVTEPEKCEYHALITGPFACPMPEDGMVDGKDPSGETPVPVAPQDDAVSVSPIPHAHDEL